MNARLLRITAVGTLLLGVAAALPTHAQPVLQRSANGLQVSAPNGYATVVRDDLVLRSEAGPVKWGRQWDGQEWKFNPQWESLSSSWKNLTGSQSADTTGATVGGAGSGGGSSGGAATATTGASGSGSGGGGCWVWVDEDWQPSYGTTLIGGLPQAEPAVPGRMTPFNRVMGEASAEQQSYPPLQRVSVDYASLCAGAAVGMPAAVDVEGIRRINELYLGDSGRYAFSNRSVLEKRAVQQVAPQGASVVQASLATGQITLSPQRNDKGFRWIDKAGDWIDYNTQGQAVAYGDRNNNTVWLVRDDSGRLRGVVDPRGRVLYTLHYTGELLTEVRDHPVAGLASDLPARSVKYGYDERNRLVQVTDVRGNVTKYAYNVSNRLVQITDAEGRLEELAYAGDAVSKHTAADGGVTDFVFEYDDVNKQFISKITGPLTEAGRRVEDLTHNRSGKLVRQIVNGRTEQEVRYDTGARAEISTNARGFSTRTVRNEFDEVVRTEHTDGAVEQRAYSALHLQLTQEVDALGVKTAYEHDARGNLLKKTEAVGLAEQRETRHEVNANGQIVRITKVGRVEVDGTVTPDAVWQIAYDAMGQVSQTTDPEGAVRRYVYDRAGNLRSYTDPRGKVTTYEVDAMGKMTRHSDEVGTLRSYTLDKLGQVVAVTDGAGQTERRKLDAMSRIIERTNAVGGIHRWRFNGAGRVVETTDEDGRILQREHDNFHQVLRLVDGAGNVTTFDRTLPDGSNGGMLGSLGQPTRIDLPTHTQQMRYDARERLSRRSLVYAQGGVERTSTTTYTHDLMGRLATETDPSGQVRRHRHDPLGQRIETTDALGGVSRWRHDARGNVVAYTDALGRVHRFAHDLNDRIVAEVRPLGQTVRYRYDALGNLVEKTDVDGTRHQHTHDARSRLVRTEVRKDDVLLRTLTYTWDAGNRITAWRDTDHVRSQTSEGRASWDASGRKLSETFTYPAGQQLGYSQQFSPAGKRTQLTWPDGTVFQMGHSPLGELASVDVPGEGNLSVQAFKWKQPERITLPGGGTQQRGHDGLGNLTDLQVRTPGQQATLQLTQRFGLRQELDARERTDTLGTASSTRSESFLHDAALRLTTVQTDFTGMSRTTESFTLDGVDNRVDHSRLPGPWTYDENHRLTQAGAGTCGGTGTVCFQWDGNGNLVQKTEAAQRVTLLRYDAFNRLSEVSLRVAGGSEVLVARYGHDPMDHRLWKEQHADRAGKPLAQPVRTLYLHGDEGLLAEATQALERQTDGSLLPVAAPRLIAQYLPRQGAPFSTGPLLARLADAQGGDTVAYFHNDHLGTPLQLTDKTGQVLWAAHTEAFGRALPLGLPAGAKTVVQPLRLPGQFEDAETGLHQNWRRQYDPDTGRYLSADPIGLEGGRNLYVYASASPLSHFDATGEETCGSGWNEPLVPDNPLTYSFSDCCQNHDDCYGQCGGPSKQTCDGNFCGCMRTECTRSGMAVSRWTCRRLAGLYCSAVTNMGGSAYDDARRKCGKPDC